MTQRTELLDAEYSKYDDVLGREANIYDSTNDNTFSKPQLIHPFLGSTWIPIVMNILAGSAKEIHCLQGELGAKEHSIDELVDADKKISPAEDAAEILSAIKFDYKPAHHAAAKARDAGKKLDNELASKIKSLEREFCKKYDLIKSAEQAHETVRQELLGCLDGFKKLNQVYDKRELPAKNVSSAKSAFNDYEIKLEKIKEIEKEIALLTEEYRSIEDSENLKKFFKHLKGASRNWIFWKGPLAKECLDADYYEGLETVKNLKDEIHEIKNKFDAPVRIKNHILEELSQLEKNSSAVDNFKKSRLSAEELKKLGDLKNNLGKYDSSQAVKTIYLGKLFGDYKNATENLRNEISDLLKAENERLEKRYEKIESECAQMPETKKEIKEYIATARKRNSELAELQAKFDAIGAEVGYENTKKLIKTNEKKIDGLEDELNAQRKKEPEKIIVEKTRIVEVKEPNKIIIEKSVEVYKAPEKVIEKRYFVEPEAQELPKAAVLEIKEKLPEKIEMPAEIYKEPEKRIEIKIEAKIQELPKITIPEAKEQLPEKVPEFKTEFPAEKEPFCLPVYVEYLGFPNNNSLFRVRDAINDLDLNWVERLKTIDSHISRMDALKNNNDLDYLKKLRYGLHQGLVSGSLAEEISLSENNKQFASKVMSNLDSYIANCHNNAKAA